MPKHYPQENYGLWGRTLTAPTPESEEKRRAENQVKALNATWPNEPDDADLHDLKGKVGYYQENRPEDVAKVQLATHKAGHTDLNISGGPTGIFGSPDHDGLIDLQRERGLKPDGKAFPGGETISNLKQKPWPQYAVRGDAMTDATQIDGAKPQQLAQANSQKPAPSPFTGHPSPPSKPGASQKGQNSQLRGEMDGPPNHRGILYDSDTEKALTKLRHRESRGNYNAENSYGYVGAYQMGKGALQDAGMLDKNGRWTGKYGVQSKEDFKNDTFAQDRVVMDYFRAQDRQMHNNKAKRAIGQTVKGIVGNFTITRDSLTAAAHREGAGAVRDYILRLEGNGWKSDINKMPSGDQRKQFEHIETRLREFANDKINIQ